MKSLFKALIFIGLGIAIGVWLSSSGGEESSAPELHEALIFKNFKSCAQPSKHEEKFYELAAEVLEQNLLVNGLWLDTGAEKFLSSGFYRESFRGGSTPVCPPEGVYSRAGKTITQRRGLEGFIDGYQLKLAALIPDPSTYIVDKVGEVAFSQ